MICVSLPCVIVSVSVLLISLITLLCSKNLRHSVPLNYILLALFTISCGLLFGAMASLLDAAYVILAISVLVATLLGLLGSALVI